MDTEKDIRGLAEQRYGAACAVVGWSTGDPGPSARDPLTLTRRKIAYWLACGEAGGISVPYTAIAEVSPRSREGVGGIVRQCVPWPGPRTAAVRAARAAFEAALAGDREAPLDMAVLSRAAAEIWLGSDRGLGAPKGSFWKRGKREARR